LTDIHYGYVKKFKISLNKTCFNCREKCNQCQGAGFLTRIMNHGIFIQEFRENCNHCNSLGFKLSNNCSLCFNKRQLIEEQTLDIKIPNDCNDGYSLLFPGLGEQPTKFNQQPGNLIIKFNIVNDTCFQRVNTYDLLYTPKISLVDSFIGKDIAIPYMDDTIHINIKRFGIINPNKEYIIEHKGLSHQGNLILKFDIIYPENKILTYEQIKLFEECFNKIEI